jgi:hypothetical protein
MPHHGRCLCGAVRFAIDAEIETVVHCHCGFCRRAHGAAFVSEAIVPAAAFTIVGGDDTLRRHQQRYFCGNCASRLFNRTETGAPLVAVALSTLDDPPDVGPGIHVNTASKAPWVEIPSGATTFPGFPPGFEPEPG